MSFAPIIKSSGQQGKGAWKRATDRMSSFLDDIELKDDVWKDVERRKWNARHPMPFYGVEACDFDITSSSAIGAHEKVVETQDLAFWERQWDLAGVKQFVRVNLPAFDDKIQDQAIAGKYKELGRAMGGKSAIRKITWPVVLILASKR